MNIDFKRAAIDCVKVDEENGRFSNKNDEKIDE